MRRNKYGDLETPDGMVWRSVMLVDYTASIYVGPLEGREKTAWDPLFTCLKPPSVRHTLRGLGAPLEAPFNVVGEHSLVVNRGWSLIITNIAAIEAAVSVTLVAHDREYHFGGPWLLPGLELESPLVVRERLVLNGTVDWRRSTAKNTMVWLRGYLHMEDR
ncbi:MAG TPA: hypothetical protein VF183_05640 [Acidimicrobiales bacterium]